MKNVIHWLLMTDVTAGRSSTSMLFLDVIVRANPLLIYNAETASYGVFP